MSVRFPVPHPERIFPLPHPERIFPQIHPKDKHFVNPGNGKRLLLGERGYPFGEAEIDSDSAVSTIQWQKEGDAFASVSLGNYPDLLTAARFVSFTPTIFDLQLIFTLRVSFADGTIRDELVDVISDVRIAAEKVAKLNERIKSFTDATFAKDSTKVAAVKYEVKGASTVAKQDIPRKLIVSGTHNGSGNNAKLVDTTKDFLALGVRVNDIVKNTTDGGSAKVTAIQTTTNANDTLALTAIAGGTDNDFDSADAFQVTDGRSLVLIAQDFELFFSVAGLHRVILYVTDTKTPTAQEFSAEARVFVS